jgi:mRNA-degrading endonuclease RelE of RelBE toxin-antitoxin system
VRAGDDHQALEETLPDSVAAAVRQFVGGPLLDNPHRVGKPLRFGLEGYYSARRRQYRVIHRIHEREVIVDVIGDSAPQRRLRVGHGAERATSHERMSDRAVPARRLPHDVLRARGRHRW